MKDSEIITKMPPRARDRSGEVHGFWSIESFSHIVKTEKSVQYYWNCSCKCGNQKPVAINNLFTKSKYPKSCGCAASRYIDRSGQRFNSWYVESFSHTDNRYAYFNVVCDCGSRQVREMSNIASGSSKSCGCRIYKKQNLGNDPESPNTETSLGSDVS